MSTTPWQPLGPKNDEAGPFCRGAGFWCHAAEQPNTLRSRNTGNHTPVQDWFVSRGLKNEVDK